MTKITHLLYSGLGGHGNVFFSLVDADKTNLYNCSAVFFGVEKIREEYIEKCTAKSIEFSYVPKRKGLSISFFIHVFQHIKQQKPDIIFLHGGLLIFPAFLYSIFMKTKIIARETQANKLKTRQDWFWLFWANVLADRVVYLSENFKTEVQSKFGVFFRKSKMAVIPNGINLEKFKPAIKVFSNKINIGMIGRIVPIKDHKSLITAFSNLQAKLKDLDLTLYIAGDGESRKELENLASQLKLNAKVIFTGTSNESELILFLQNLDIYVHASYGETMSTAIMQAQACGLPIIGSNVDGINNVIEHNRTGILVEVNNPNALQEAISELIANNELRQKLANDSLNYAAMHLSANVMFEKYHKLISQL